jgi:hypothetical protein
MHGAVPVVLGRCLALLTAFLTLVTLCFHLLCNPGQNALNPLEEQILVGVSQRQQQLDAVELPFQGTTGRRLRTLPAVGLECFPLGWSDAEALPLLCPLTG